MKLHISDSTGTIVARHEGKLADLTAIVKADLRDNQRVTPLVLKGQMTRLSRRVNGVRSTSLVDNDFKVVVQYRIYS